MEWRFCFCLINVLWSILSVSMRVFREWTYFAGRLQGSNRYHSRGNYFHLYLQFSWSDLTGYLFSCATFRHHLRQAISSAARSVGLLKESSQTLFYTSISITLRSVLVRPFFGKSHIKVSDLLLPFLLVRLSVYRCLSVFIKIPDLPRLKWSVINIWDFGMIALSVVPSYTRADFYLESTTIIFFLFWKFTESGTVFPLRRSSVQTTLLKVDLIIIYNLRTRL